MVIYDIETLRSPDEVKTGWDDPHALGFGTAIVYDYDTDVYNFFTPGEENKCISLLSGKKVISFNGIRFDNAVLLGKDYKPQWEDYDILAECIKAKFKTESIKEAQDKKGKWTVFDGSLKMDSICRNTIKMTKIGEGAYAPTLIKEKRWKEVFEYNLHDVRMTKNLYEFIQENAYVIDGKGNKIEFYNGLFKDK